MGTVAGGRPPSAKAPAVHPLEQLPSQACTPDVAGYFSAPSQNVAAFCSQRRKILPAEIANRDVSCRYFAEADAANSVEVSSLPISTRHAATSGSTARTSRPVAVLPVASLTQPIRYGPPNPAR